MYGYTYSKSMDQPGKVANPARGQLNRENGYFSVCDPLTFVLICDHEQDWHLICLWLTYCAYSTVGSSVARTIR